ncbi:MAG: 3-phosphoshikimate 1-carboxyvinyltransferase [Alphaproteobacteria bacterium GM7ARS4]|nr:3-phosphoshikimate 1-carboxyvinyltransferase [Alphaproteobacteria bacterium GM7ARS4]
MKDTLYARPYHSACLPSGQHCAGTIRVPSDKSLSHRALIIASMAWGRSSIDNLLESDDVFATLNALRALGVRIEKDDAQNSASRWHVYGEGGYFMTPAEPLFMGNAGTATRLLAGVVSSQAIVVTFEGDNSLSQRPMERISVPLSQSGASFTLRDGRYLPMTVRGTTPALACQWASPISSAQVKSALLLAGMKAIGLTHITEPSPSRDHTEHMLRHFGASVLSTTDKDKGIPMVSMASQQRLEARALDIPADPSSAAFLAAAHLIVHRHTPNAPPMSLRDVLLNPHRIGFFRAIHRMGAHVTYHDTRTTCGETIGTLHITSRPLHAIETSPDDTASMIDEYPILAILAAYAQGISRFRGLNELRMKESDRLYALYQGLTQCGTQASIEGDDLIVHGQHTTDNKDKTENTPILLSSQGDHRIAMAFLIYALGGHTQRAIGITNASTINSSFPHFQDTMAQLSVPITPYP